MSAKAAERFAGKTAKEFEVEVGGRKVQIAVRRAGDGFAISIDGRTHHVDVARIGAHTLSLILDSRRPADATVTADRATGQLTVHVGGTEVPVSVNGRRRALRRDDRHARSGPQRVTAPMPGKVVRVPVAVGDDVRARQPVVVVEAMKMENELRAGRDGTVAEIHAREGMSVDAGALLVVIQ
jgi:biotin carboxyl carrier protein